MDQPAVSIIIPTYNRATLVPRAVASVMAALQPHDEVIVVDDGSTDDTVAALANFQSRIRYLRQPNQGAGAARNHGIRAARSPLIAFLDSDDEWMPDKLQLQRQLMARHPQLVFCCSDFAVRARNGAIHRRYLVRWCTNPRPWPELLGAGRPYSTIAPLPAGRPDFQVYSGDLSLAEMEEGYVATFTLMVRRELAGPALWFAEDLPTFEDTECAGRLALAGPMAFLDCETAWQHGHAGPRLTDANAYVCATARLTVLERVWGSHPDFLARYGQRYQQARAAEYHKRARWLLRQGRLAEARANLHQAGGGRPWQRWLVRLPDTAPALRLVRRLVELCRRRRRA